MQIVNKNVQSETPDWWQFDDDAWQEITSFFNSDELENDALWQRLKLGQSNISFRLRLNNQHYFIQLPNQYNHRLRPFKGQYTALDRWLVGTDVEQWLTTHFVDSPRVCISEWIDNDPQYIRFSNQSLKKQLIQFLLQLHQTPAIHELPQASNHLLQGADWLAQPLDMLEHINYYFEQAVKASPEQFNTIELLRNEAHFFAQSYEASCFCHSDLNPYNLLWDANKEQLKIIDWEYACFSDPLLDLAGLLVHWPLSPTEQTQLVEGYQAHSGKSIDSQKLKNMGCLSIVLSKLWRFASQNG